MSLLRLNLRPSPRQLLVFGLAWLAFGLALGFSLWRRDHLAAAVICWGLALWVPAVGCVWPKALRLLYVGLSHATYPIGWVVSSLVLLALYYGVLTPIGLVLRLVGRDPLRRRFREQAASHWHPRPSPPSPESYFRQH